MVGSFPDNYAYDTRLAVDERCEFDPEERGRRRTEQLRVFLASRERDHDVRLLFVLYISHRKASEW